jgi:hypothetical protein
MSKDLFFYIGRLTVVPEPCGGLARAQGPKNRGLAHRARRCPSQARRCASLAFRQAFWNPMPTLPAGYRFAAVSMQKFGGSGRGGVSRDFGEGGPAHKFSRAGGTALGYARAVSRAMLVRRPTVPLCPGARGPSPAGPGRAPQHMKRRKQWAGF